MRPAELRARLLTKPTQLTQYKPYSADSVRVESTTHKSKLTCAATAPTPSTQRMAELAGAVDELKLVGDFAHWTAMTETEPGACAVLDAAITTIAPHVHHLHARVGHANASQVGVTGGRAVRCDERVPFSLL